MLMALVVVLAVSLSISFLCSLLEACILSLSPTDVAAIEQRSPAKGKILREFQENLQNPLAVILILNTFAHTIGASLGGGYIEVLYGDRWLIAFSIILSFIMIQWTEILPKTLGVRFNRQLTPFIAIPLHSCIQAIKPLVKLIHYLNGPFEARGAHKLTAVEDIQALAKFALLSKQIAPQQVQIISAGAALSEQKVREIMVPTEEMSFLDRGMSLQDAFDKTHADAHSRYPLCESNDINSVIGYVNLKELVSVMRTNPDEATLEGISRPIDFVSPDETCSAVLKLLVGGHSHMAIIRDSQGTTLGIVTMEDILEVLVGDIEDEFDYLPRIFHMIGDNALMVGGGLQMQELAERAGIDLPGCEGAVSDWIVERLGRIPRPNDVVTVGKVTLTVRRVRRHRVYEAMITTEQSKDII